MRLLIPEIASPIGFFVTFVLFTLFCIIVYRVFSKDKASYREVENLPLDDDTK